MVQEINQSSFNVLTRYETVITYDLSVMLAHLHIGISLPILPGFEDYLLDAFNYYRARAILLYERIENTKLQHVVGYTLLYED